MIERTPYKDTVYVWHLNAPFFFPRRYLDLNTSCRIRSSEVEVSHYFQGNDQAITNLVLTRLRETGLTDSLAREMTLGEYLARTGRRPFRCSDNVKAAAYFAAAAFLAGDHAWSSECLDFCRLWLEKERRVRNEHGEEASPFVADLETFIPLFDSPPAEVARRIHAIVRDNAERLGFIAGDAAKDIALD